MNLAITENIYKDPKSRKSPYRDPVSKKGPFSEKCFSFQSVPSWLVLVPTCFATIATSHTHRVSRSGCKETSNLVITSPHHYHHYNHYHWYHHYQHYHWYHGNHHIDWTGAPATILLITSHEEGLTSKVLLWVILSGLDGIWHVCPTYLAWMDGICYVLHIGK